METETLNKQCSMCDNEATGKIKSSHNETSISLCERCAKEMLWELIHADYQFIEDN